MRKYKYKKLVKIDGYFGVFTSWAKRTMMKRVIEIRKSFERDITW